MKKALKWVVIGTGIFILLLILTPIIFRHKIIAAVKSEINHTIQAKVDFKDVNLSLIRHFPQLSIGLDDISVLCLEPFAGDTLLSAKRLDVSINLLSVFKDGPIDLRGVYVIKPRIKALVNEEGIANWDITNAGNDENSANADTSSFSIKLKQYAITDGYVLYEDKSMNMSAKIEGLNHSGSGDFASELFTLSTSTKAAGASFTYNGIPYLVNTATGINADFDINNKTATYKFKHADVSMNQLKLSLQGFLQILNDSTYNMDLSFKTPSTDFVNILSLIHAVYKNDFDKLKTGGSASLNGFVKGVYNNSQMPAYQFNIDIKNGSFHYPDLPEPVKNIRLSFLASNPDGVYDNAIFEIKDGHIEMGGDAFDFHMHYKKPETLQFIDAAVKGKVDLGKVNKFIKFDQSTKLAGIVLADAYMKGSLKDMQKQTGAFTVGGFFNVSKLFYQSASFPQAIHNGSLKVELENTGGNADNTAINISNGYVEIGQNPLSFSLKLTKPVSSVDFAGNIKGGFDLSHLKQFVQFEPESKLSGLLNADLSFAGSKAIIDKMLYDQVHTKGMAELKNIHFSSKDYPDGIIVTKATLQAAPTSISLENFTGSIMKTNITASGSLYNFVNYFLKNEMLKGELNLAADKVNLNQWLKTDTSITASEVASSKPFAVPANIYFTVNTKVDEVNYDKVKYNNVKGTLVVKDEAIYLQHVQTEALDGNIFLNGSFSTREDKNHPQINLSYDVKNIDIQKTFFAFNTIQKLMPVGKFLAGKFNSNLTLSGKLNGEMMPEFSTLTGNGNVLMMHGVLSKFQPLEKIAEVLQIKELQGVTLKDLKSQVEFANGKVLVKPFNFKIKDIDLQIGGMHSFDQQLDYIVLMKLPRSYLGTNGNLLVNNLAAKANNKGIPIQLGETVELNIKMGGTINQPIINTDLKQSAVDASKELKQQANAFVQQKIDSSKQSFKDSLNSTKNLLITDLKNEAAKQFLGSKDSANKNGLEETKKKAEESIKGTINNLLNRKKKQSDSTINQ